MVLFSSVPVQTTVSGKQSARHMPRELFERLLGLEVSVFLVTAGVGDMETSHCSMIKECDGGVGSAWGVGGFIE